MFPLQYTCMCTVSIRICHVVFELAESEIVLQIYSIRVKFLDRRYALCGYVHLPPLIRLFSGQANNRTLSILRLWGERGAVFMIARFFGYKWVHAWLLQSLGYSDR